MSVASLVLAMTVIFLLILIGYFLSRKGLMTDRDTKFLSFLVTSVTNPCMTLDAAISMETPLSLTTLGIAFVAAAFTYAVLIAAGLLIPALLRIEKTKRYQYQLMTIFGNIGFIGFPVCSTVLGKESLAYASISCLLFNILIYTYGLSICRKAAAASGNTAAVRSGAGSIINVGMISSVITVLLYIFHPQVPSVIAKVAAYCGNATVFLSMLVLGGALAAMPLRDLFLGEKRMYGFLAIRLIVLPVLMVLALKLFLTDRLMLGTMTILLALPGANMPLMFCREMDLDNADLARGILLSTLLCIATIPVVCLFL